MMLVKKESSASKEFRIRRIKLYIRSYRVPAILIMCEVLVARLFKNVEVKPPTLFVALILCGVLVTYNILVYRNMTKVICNHGEKQALDKAYHTNYMWGYYRIKFIFDQLPQYENWVADLKAQVYADSFAMVIYFFTTPIFAFYWHIFV